MNSVVNFINKLISLFDRAPVIIGDLRKKYQYRVSTFLFFVFIAFVFWFIRALNEPYESDIYYPIRFTNLPENKILTDKPPEKLKLKVEAPGLKILLQQLNLKINVLRFNVESYSQTGDTNNSFFIVTRQVKEFITEDLVDVKILSISPDTIFFHFEDVVSRKVPVKVMIGEKNNLLETQFIVNGKIYTVPDSMVVTGPASLTDTLSYICTSIIEAKYLTDTLNKVIPLQDIDRLKFAQQKVRVIIPVDKFTESSVTSIITPINVPDSLTLVTFPATVKITYRIAMSNYEKVNPDLIIPFVDYTDIMVKSENQLTVGLIDTPEWIYDVRLSPAKVEYIIER